MAILFLVFLLVFVLVGIYPAFQRTAAKIRRFIKAHEKPVWTRIDILQNTQPTTYELPLQNLTLHEFEIFILRRLAQAGRKGLTRKQINADLHFEPEVVKNTLASLKGKRLIQVVMNVRPGMYFGLSEQGRRFAFEQGYLPRIHNV